MMIGSRTPEIRWRRSAVLLLMAVASFTRPVDGRQSALAAKLGPAPFRLQEATIAQIQQAIQTGRITTVGLVELYLKRIKAYNGTCVNEPQGILGPITTIPHAGQLK